ncbi:alpha-L-fucosidase [Halomontanus rarus]|uniref:alpha-L-fucosidase n=1 Tax=Halomontanus rarus TaxID=3034020 RepID=UPI001A9A0EFD
MKDQPRVYEPNWDSIDEHECPDWYHDAKLGIFIHWGIYSVPAWADPDGDHAYAEWYPYYMYEEGSDTREYHREHYGDDVEYADFIDDWDAENWDPDAWAAFFEEIGARYVVLTGEHHDGFALWDSHYTKYNTTEMGPKRDLVGELADAVDDHGLRFAASYHANLNYYQPGFDGRFGHPDFEGADGNFRSEGAGPGSEYVDFMNAKHRELIRQYDPDLLWFDVPCAEGDHLRAQKLIADYYNRAEESGKEVMVNDRASTDATRTHGDFYTPEYETFDEIQEKKWETCRGIGSSFGYNHAETEDNHLTATELVHLLVDVVSKNGNLLINVGPKADGTIPDLQKTPLQGLGEWLDDNGEAIHGTRPWIVSEDDLSEVEVRYTWSDNTLYATCLEWPGDRLELALGDHIETDAVENIEFRGDKTSIDWERNDTSVAISIDGEPTGADGSDHAYVFELAGVPNPRR